MTHTFQIKELKGYLNGQEILSSDKARLIIDIQRTTKYTKDGPYVFEGSKSWYVKIDHYIYNNLNPLSNNIIQVEMSDNSDKYYSGDVLSHKLLGTGQLNGLNF